MACIEKDRPDGFADVSFLYKVKRGLASKSHGLNVARMAQLPDSVLKTALRKSRALEEILDDRRRRRRVELIKSLLGGLASGQNSDVVVELARRLLA